MSCYFYFVLLPLGLNFSECDVMSLYFFGVALLMYLFVLFVACLTMFVNCLVKQFAMCGVVAVLLLNVMDVFSVAGLLDRPCMVCWIDCVWSSTECACCACNPSVHLSIPSICFCMSEVISSFKSLRSHVFALLMLFLC